MHCYCFDFNRYLTIFLSRSALEKTLEAILFNLESEILTHLLSILHFFWNGLEIIKLEQSSQSKAHFLHCKVLANTVSGSIERQQTLDKFFPSLFKKIT